MARSASGRLAFIKLQALGNHFLVIDARERPLTFSEHQIRSLCAHRVGVGADQLIVIERSDSADALLRIYNVDGFEAEACGNATRCVADYLMNHLGQSSVRMATRGGLIKGSRCAKGMVRIELQAPHLHSQQDLIHGASWGPLTGGVGVFVGYPMGNPHIIFFNQTLNTDDLCRWAPSIQRDPLFRESVNVTLAKIQSPREITIATFERAVGLTNACGTGALATVFAASQTLGADFVQDPNVPVRVRMPGGDVLVQVLTHGQMWLTGPVATVFRGELPWPKENNG